MLACFVAAQTVNWCASECLFQKEMPLKTKPVALESDKYSISLHFKTSVSLSFLIKGIEWSLGFKVSFIYYNKNSLHLKASHHWHHSNVFKINIPPF